jgi:protease YdgD
MSESPTRFKNWFRTASTALLVTVCILSGLSRSKSDVIKIEDRQAGVPDSLWSAVGKLYNGTGAGCTATVIEPDKLLTAAHCVFNRRTGFFLRPSSMHFLLGLDGDDYRAHALVESYGIEPHYDPNRSLEIASNDWAVLRLKQPLSVEYRPVELSRGMPKNGSSVLTGGYGQDRAFAISVDGNCRVLEKVRNLLVHNCHANRGYSGAPLIQLASGAKPAQIVGIHVARGYFQGARVSIAIPAALIAPQDARAPMTSIQILSKRMSQDEDQRILDQLEFGN